jgi:hypothetical protein
VVQPEPTPKPYRLSALTLGFVWRQSRTFVFSYPLDLGRPLGQSSSWQSRFEGHSRRRISFLLVPERVSLISIY